MHPILAAWYRRYKTLVWVVGVTWVLYTLAGFVAVPLVAHHVLNTTVSQALRRTVTVGTIRANPYTFSMQCTGLAIAEADGAPFVFVNQLRLNVDPLLSLFKWGAVVKSIRINGPQLRVVRTGKARFNFSELIPPTPEKAPPTQTTTKPLRLVLKQFTLSQGRITFVDNAQAAPFETTLTDVALALNNVDTQPGAGAALYRFSARSDAAETLQINGQSNLDPLEVQAAVTLDNLVIANYAPYYGGLFNARVADGRLGLTAKAHWSAARQTIDDIFLTLTRLALTPKDDPQAMLTVPQFSIEGASIDLKQQQIQLGRIASQDGTLAVQRNVAGELNLQTAFAPPPSPPVVAQPVPAPPTAAQAPPWRVRLTALDLENFRVDFTDQQTDPMVQWQFRVIGITAQDLSTQKDHLGSATLNLAWADQGRLGLEGELGLAPFQAKLALKADKLDIRPLQPYLNQHARLVITNGDVSANGRLDLLPNEGGLTVHYSGQAALNRFESVDAEATGDFLKFKSLYLSGLELDSAPLRLIINEVALTDFFNRLIINSDGKSNVGAIFSTPAGTAETAEKAVPAKAPDIRINTITLQDGRIDFSDRQVKPNVRLPMQAIGGRISGLDTIKANKADVLLRGTLDNSAPLEITGKINPLIAKPFVDLNVNISGIDLSPFTPYAGKYLGYKLEKGQLSLQLNYLVADNKLAGRNKVALNQLTLGETVASPDATQLPIQMALALLKDRNGDIDLDLPVSGDLDDPEFSVGGIVVKMFVNLITNIVSSPFKLLGALFGGGEELAFMKFDPGQAAVLPEGSTKLANLAKILYERPGLKLEIKGQVHPEMDTEGLRQLRFDQQLKATKLKKMMAGGQKALPLDQIELTPQERTAQVQHAFAAATFPKPRDEKGKLKPLTPLEMEKLLYTAIEITADDLGQLARQRASTAKEWLLTYGKVDPQRLFVTAPQIKSQPTKKEHAPQVRFVLK
jgi:hypothetical protein